MNILRAVFLEKSTLDNEQLAGLYQSFAKRGLSFNYFRDQLAQDNLKVFVVGDDENQCYVAVSVIDSDGVRELVLDGMWMNGQVYHRGLRGVIGFLHSLGREWGCQKVSTALLSGKQLRWLLKQGFKVDYVAVSMEIGNVH